MIPRDRLVLGTAKFGMPQYGYASTSRPTAAESIAILRHAWRQGIRLFDTALGYGDAMALLQYAGVPCECIISKFRLPLRRPLYSDLRWLVHNPTADDMEYLPVDSGVSVYTVAEVEAARRLGIAPIQAPASCLNPAVEVEYGRAPFLQGVLMRPAHMAPPALRVVVDAFQEMSDGPLRWLALALHAAYGERLVFGVSSIQQLDEVLTACDSPTPPEELIGKARALALTVDATAALPSLWSKT